MAVLNLLQLAAKLEAASAAVAAVTPEIIRGHVKDSGRRAGETRPAAAQKRTARRTSWRWPSVLLPRRWPAGRIRSTNSFTSYTKPVALARETIEEAKEPIGDDR